MKVATILCAVILMSAAAAFGGGDRLQVWRSSYFDGTDFRDGIALDKPSVYHRNGYLPIIQSGDESIPNDRLPKGTAAMVIHCFVQSSGGKLVNRSGSEPVAGAAILINGGGGTLLLRTDDEGYALIAMPVGGYEISVKGIARKVTLEKGKTLLLPIRVGRRMVD